MEPKELFLQAVRILAPGDQALYQAAQQINEESLPMAPGGAALEFIRKVQRRKIVRWSCRARFKLLGHAAGRSETKFAANKDITFDDAIRIKTAELWIKLGQPEQAILELRSLPEQLQHHSWVLKTHLAAIRACRDSH